MSRDIRSFFTTVTKKTTTSNNGNSSKKRLVSELNSSTDDIVPDTPDNPKKPKTSNDNARSKRKRILAISSGSESDKDNTKKKPSKTPTKQNHKTKPSVASKTSETLTKHANQKKIVSALDVFGDEPVKQEKIDKKPDAELNIHDDDDFDKTLLELDEEELLRNVEEKPTQTEHKKNELKTPAKAKTPSLKRKTSENTDDSVTSDPDQDRHEKKRYSAMLYQKYLNRSGPVNPGSKWLPKGKVDCLKGLCFIITGVLESLERSDAETLITYHGGRCTHSVSGKVNYMVLGDDAGPAKVEKARKVGTKMISEDDLIELICAKSGISNENATKSEQPVVKQKAKEDDDVIPAVTVRGAPKERGDASGSQPWVEKYKPQDLTQIIGQQGERSNVKKLLHWLRAWHKNRAAGKGVARPSPWARDDDGAYFRAALLSGPPGVGKTTTAHLVCAELRYDVVEFNASDTRNKRMVHDEVAHVLNSMSLAGYFHAGAAPTRRRVLLMDEVDGMSGNEDRGGIQELIALIKTSDVPIICMCNDRQHQKIRTLANHCFDLRFSKPRLEQIRGAMMSICFKEGIKIKGDTLTQLIQNTGHDIRQSLNQLSLLAIATIPQEAANQPNTKPGQKDTKLGPWEVIRKVFSAEEHKSMSLADKSKLFFYDYSIGPLFVHENYLKVVPHGPKAQHLRQLAAAAEAISVGDVVDAKIRSTQNWSLLELHGMYASVLPGHYLSGHFAGQIDFPSWLGKNSKASKFHRMLTEVQTHTRTATSGDRIAINLDYIRSIRDAITSPLLARQNDGIPDAIAVMRAYNLLREDLTSLVELCHWPKIKDPFDSIDSKVKSAFTRTYNREGPVLPYAAPSAGPVKAKKTAVGDVDDVYAEYAEDAGEESNNEQDDDVATDAMIKSKTKKAAPTKPKASGRTASGPKARAGSSKRAKK